MWDASLDLKHAKTLTRQDLPCTIGWQFLLRDGVLHMVCNMRSNDFWLGFPNDVFVNTLVQRYVANELCAAPGSYTHNAGSMHLYDRNLAAADLATEIAEQHLCDWDSFGDVRAAVDLEAKMRDKRIATWQELRESPEWGLLGDCLKDIVICVAQPWLPGSAMPAATALRKGLSC